MKSALLASAVFVFSGALLGCGDDGSSDGPDSALGGTGFTVIDYGDVVAGEEVEIVLPPNTLGAHIVADFAAPNPSASLGIQNLTTPGGADIVTGYDFQGTPVSSEQDLVAVSLSQTDRETTIPPESGTWLVTPNYYNSTGDEPIRLTAYIQSTEDGQFPGATLDVRIYIPEGLLISDPTPSHMVSAGTAADDEAITARLDSFFGRLSSMFGIERGDVVFYDVGAEFTTLDLFSGGVNQALRVTTPGGDDRALHIVLTNGITLGGMPVAWGIAAGIPGAALRPASSMAGIALDVTQGLGAAADGVALVHEMGHFVGLRHTTEVFFSLSDLLEDTPMCANPQEAASCPDASNFMFPDPASSGAVNDPTASPNQVAIFQGSPMIRLQAVASRTGDDENAQAASIPAPHNQLEQVLRAGLCAHSPRVTTEQLRAYFGAQNLERQVEALTASGVASKALRARVQQIHSELRAR